MLTQFALVLVFLVISAGFVFVSLFLGRFFRPRKSNKVKEEVYECGEQAIGSAWIGYNMRFYLLALIFIIFDVEVALMLPVAVVFKKWVANGFGILVLIEMGLFIAILVVGLAYLWKKRDLEWIKTVNSEQ
jgi:NADH-quinone oxidoreductase subunit A